jgi:hypothetical protein
VSPTDVQSNVTGCPPEQSEMLLPVHVSMLGLAGEHVSVGRLQRAVYVLSQVPPAAAQSYDA